MRSKGSLPGDTLFTDMKDYTTTVSDKGQVIIPKAFREHLGIAPGDPVVLTVSDGAIVLTPPRERIVTETGGSRAGHERRRR
jgi:AbrB family looped-hinge helix DNA binding protein